jgi:hypothetical protein
MLSLSDQKRADHGWVGYLLDLFFKYQIFLFTVPNESKGTLHKAGETAK